MKNTFHQKVFFISTLLHAEKRSLKRPLFKFEKNKKNDLDSRPYSSKTIIGRSFNFTLNFSSGIRLQLMFLEYHRKMNFKGSYAIFPKPSDIFTVQPHRRDSPASPYHLGTCFYVISFVEQWSYRSIDHSPDKDFPF